MHDVTKLQNQLLKKPKLRLTTFSVIELCHISFNFFLAADIDWKHLLIKSVLPSVGWIWCVRDAKTVVNTRHSRTSAFLCFFTDTRIIFRTRGADRLHSSSGPRIVASCSLSLSSRRNGEQGVKTRNLWHCCCSAADTHLLSLATRQPAATFHLLTPSSLLASPLEITFEAASERSPF